MNRNSSVGKVTG